MAMVYQRGNVYEKGTLKKKWYGKFRVYMRDQDGKEVERTRRVVLGLKSELASTRPRRNCKASSARRTDSKKGAE